MLIDLRALRRCEEKAIGAYATAHVDLATDLLERERGGPRHTDKSRFSEGAQNMLVAAAVAVVMLSAGSYWLTRTPIKPIVANGDARHRANFGHPS